MRHPEPQPAPPAVETWWEVYVERAPDYTAQLGGAHTPGAVVAVVKAPVLKLLGERGGLAWRPAMPHAGRSTLDVPFGVIAEAGFLPPTGAGGPGIIYPEGGAPLEHETGGYLVGGDFLHGLLHGFPPKVRTRWQRFVAWWRSPAAWPWERR